MTADTSTPHPPLEGHDEAHRTTGWEPDAPIGDTLLRRFVFNLATTAENPIAAMGGRVARRAEFAAADLGRPAGYWNGATAVAAAPRRSCSPGRRARRDRGLLRRGGQRGRAAVECLADAGPASSRVAAGGAPAAADPSRGTAARDTRPPRAADRGGHRCGRAAGFRAGHGRGLPVRRAPAADAGVPVRRAGAR